MIGKTNEREWHATLVARHGEEYNRVPAFSSTAPQHRQTLPHASASASAVDDSMAPVQFRWQMMPVLSCFKYHVLEARVLDQSQCVSQLSQLDS